MSKTEYKYDENGLLALYEELEVRFGPALAQSIVDEIKKVNASDQGNDQDYMAVKALSEVVELFRREARHALKALKAVRRGIAKDLPESIPSLAGECARRDLERKLACYHVAQKAFYTLYRRALKEIEYPGKKYQTVHLPEMMSKAA